MGQGIRQLPITVNLRRLFPFASFVGCADIHVSEATERSSECRPNALFAAIRGTRVDGLQFAAEAVNRGAGALLVESPLSSVVVPQCVVPNVRRAYAELCAALAGHPSRKLRLAGVTGTNGKTTVTWMIRSILQQAGLRTGLLGTIEYNDGAVSQPSALTTPDSKTLAGWLAAMVARGTTHAAMELSSHALDQDRAAGTELDVAVVTNVTHDHFDYHKQFEAYLSSKARIAGLCGEGGLVVLNQDDPGSAAVVARIPESREVLTFGIEQPADFMAILLEESLEGTRFVVTGAGERVELTTTLVGRHNVSNCLAAAVAARHLGLDWHHISEGLEHFRCVPGRLERFECGQPYDVFVDYAHTEDALRRSVHALRRLTAGRVICVFGAGGDRDKLKRPLLGRAASEADFAVITSDNPRSEDPEQIIREILAGCDSAPQPPHIEPDRAEAIRWALLHAEPGDCVLIAGKGHETEQIIGSERLPFDDREVVRSVLGGRTTAARERPLPVPV